MLDNILQSIKADIIGNANDTVFDEELLTILNSSFSKLIRGGYPYTGNSILTKDSLFSEIAVSGMINMAIRTYFLLNTRLLFDPPSNSFIVDALNRECSELYWGIVTELEINTEEITKL